MNSVTEPVAKQAHLAGNTLTVKEWLDALSGGACDEAQFLGGVADTLRTSPDSGWELLGLVDQYYRRGKLSANTFGLVKTHLQGLMVGTGTSDEVSAPPRMQGEPASAPPPYSSAPPPYSSAPPRYAAAPAPAAVAAPTPSPTRAPLSPPTAASGPVSAQTLVRPVGVTERAPAGAAAAPPGAPRGAPSVGDPSPRQLTAGDVLRGRYVVQGLVGRGAMGTVYAAIDQFRLDRNQGEQQVALKVLHTEVIKRPRLFAELRREFQHLQTLSHPNIVRVHEFDRDGDLAFFTMEYLSGTLLSRVLSGPDASPLYRPYALAIIRDVGAAVAHAHARGVVHGDLNPANIFVTDQGEVRVLDFGASHQLRRDPWISDFENQQQIKVATPGYASCQVLEGETAEARDDVFSLACVAYLLLTGDKPFRDATALKARTLRMSPTRPRGLTARQWNVLRVGLNLDRDRRPADVQDWLRRLDLAGAAPRLPPVLSLRNARPPRHDARNWAVAVVVLAGLAAAAWLSMERADSRSRAGNAVNEAVTWTVDHAITGELWAKELLSGGRQPAAEAPAVAQQPPEAEQPNEAARPAPQPAAQPPTPAAVMLATPANSRAPRAEPAPHAEPAPSTESAPRVEPAPGAETAPSPAVTAAGFSGAASRAHIDLAADSVELAPADPIAHIVVRRTRNLRDDVSFSWWTEAGTAKPGRDFVPVKPQVEHIDSGQSALSLIIPVVVDPSRRDSRNFYVVIDQPSDNATLGTHTLTMVTVPGSAE